MLERPKLDVIADLRARHPRRSAEIVELIADARLNTSVDAFEVLTPPNPAYRDVVRAIDVPIQLVIGGSTIVTRGMATELRGLNPRVRVESIVGVGHGLPFDHSERLAEVTATFLRELGSRKSGGQVSARSAATMA
jgi:pimeloyl-ACP methyl ester carboxylesterase